MTSPSSSSTSRSTPCVLGCWGPMLTVIVSVRSSAIGRVAICSVRAFDAVALQVGPEFLLGDLERLVGLRRLPDLDRVVLALRVAFPVLRHQQPPQVRMA